MHQKIKRYFFFIFLIMPGYFEASPLCTHPVAKVVSVQGKVDSQYSGNSEWQPLQVNDIFCPGDKIRTEKWSRATLILSNESLVTLDQNTTLTFSKPEEKTSTWLLKLIDGSAFFRSRKPQRLNIQTPFINAVHEGTEFLVTVDDQQTTISVFDGQVAAENKAGRIQIKKGYSGIAQQNQPPRLQALTITPENAVQWTLYYPPVIDYQHQKSSISAPSLKSALDSYQQGDVYQALARLDEVPLTYQNSEYLTLKASLLLTVGRVDEAVNSINRTLRIQHEKSTVFALQSIIAVAKNQQNTSLDLALKAATLNPKSSVAKIALSYAYQSLFKIKEALRAAQEATHLTPDNALAWARLSELQLSTGDHDGALIAAQKAQNLNPKLARTQIILGFADLAQVNIDAAKKAFEQAIDLDSSDPLARLGLGLAKIRKGALEEGTKDLETAVNLDPNNAVIRSYLGKAYYELRNKDYAGAELNIAKEMDPKDPTPWFYDAILKQTTNRPVEALHDMQKAIELNNNRGVYRSSLALDKDLAARSAAQGRIYNELGFQQQGLLEGWKSVNRDHNNYSAHRLLADNYAALPRHEIARVSELLQSQLLQPINITPIQPNLAESNIFILNGLGPTNLSFNEFNPLFEYNRIALQGSGIYGGNNTKGDNVLFSGIRDNISFSLGQFHYETDGFRENNSFNQNIYNAFLQDKITDNLNLQFEYRHEEKNNGDLTLNFDSGNFNKDFRQKSNVDSYRVGGRYEFSPDSSIIGSFSYQEVDTLQNNSSTTKILPSLFIQDSQLVNSKRNGFISELQHNYIKSKYSFISGFGHIEQPSKKTQTIQRKFIFEGNTFDFPLPPSVPEVTVFRRTNIYNYLKLYFDEKLSTTVGLSIDFYSQKDLQFTPFNPKFGIVWSPFTSTTVRAAIFRAMSIARNANQSIEPTQVAGFNQFFDDILGTVSWRFGVGVDHKLSDRFATGIEYSERKLYMPRGINGVERSEQVGRAYFNFTPLDKVSLGVEYFYEKIDQPGRGISSDNALSGDLFDVVETHRVPVTFSLFHQSGLSLKIKNSFIHQSGVFQNPNTLSLSHGVSNFFVVDLNLSYRFPKRYGLVSFGFNNLFNDKFNYQNTNNNDITLSPERLVYSRITLAF